MKIKLHLNTVMIFSLVIFFSSALTRAEEGKIFSESGSRYHKVWRERNKIVDDDKAAARRGKGKPRYTGDAWWNLHYKMYKDCRDSFAQGPEAECWRMITDHVLIHAKIDKSQFEKDAAKVEKELRQWWKKLNSIHSPASFEDSRRMDLAANEFPLSDFLKLYNRYRHDKRWDDAVRIATEMLDKYGWIWTARDWEDRQIDSMFNGGKVNQACEKVAAFAEKHIGEPDAHPIFERYIRKLISLQKWPNAVALCAKAVEKYKDCDWEPEFLQLSVLAAQGAKTEESVRLAAGCFRRAISRYPNSPDAGEAIYRFFDFALSGAKGFDKDEAIVLVGEYLQKNPESHAWKKLYNRGKSFVSAKRGNWAELDKARAEIDKNAGERGEELTRLVESKIMDGYVENLCKFVEKYPDSKQARSAMDAIVKFLGRPELVIFARDNVKKVSAAIDRAFTKSPQFASRAQQRVADLFAHPFCDFIYRKLIQKAKSKVQEEWYCYRDAMRSINCQTYNVDSLKTWGGKFPDSYRFPEVVRKMCWRAWEEKNGIVCAQIAAMLAKGRYTNSLLAYGLAGTNVHSYMPLALSRMQLRNPKKYGTKKSPSSAFSKLEKKFAGMAEKTLKVFYSKYKDKVHTGRIYWAASKWGDEIRLAGNETPKETLKNKFKNTYYYYLARAYADK